MLTTLVLDMIMRSSPLQADKCFVFAFNNVLAMQSLLDCPCFTAFAQGFCLLIIDFRASLGAKLGAALVSGGYRGSRSITLRGPLLKFAGQTLPQTLPVPSSPCATCAQVITVMLEILLVVS